MQRLPFRMLIADDNKAIIHSLYQVFEANKWFLQSAMSSKQCFDMLEKQTFDLVLLDLHFAEGDADGLFILEKIKSLYPKTEVIVFSGNTDVEKVAKAMKLNAFDYIEKGGKIDLYVLRSKVNRCHDAIIENRKPTALHATRGKRITLNVNVNIDKKPIEMIGQSAAIQRVAAKIEKLAPHDISVLIGGENGTGKELVAQALHYRSKRKNQPFIAFNCAGLTESVLQTELFGYEKGAFTGADTDKIGFFRAADGGTLFLDEIGEIPMTMQIALLRVLETKTVTPVGATVPIPIDIRIISASNKKMLECIKQGIIREDFYHRICQQRIIVPALSKRREDIPLLVDYFLKKIAEQEAMPLKTIATDALEILINHTWTGNIRALLNFVYALNCMTEDAVIYKSDVENCMEDMYEED